MFRTGIASKYDDAVLPARPPTRPTGLLCRGFGKLKIYEGETLSKTPSREQIHGRAGGMLNKTTIHRDWRIWLVGLVSNW